MDYTEFKEKLLERLRNLCGDGAEVELTDVPKNNGIHYDELQIWLKKDSPNVVPAIRVEELYNDFARGDMDMEDCIQVVLDTLIHCSIPKSVEQIAGKLKDWDYVKDKIFPMLLFTESNQELLQKLAATKMLDLSVVYAIRIQTADGFDGNAKINKELLESYGISIEQLHRQAMDNLRKDGYKFQEMESFIIDTFGTEVAGRIHKNIGQDVKVYVLTNASKLYGAAGILDTELLKEFAEGRDYYILPSSIHETIFAPVTNDDISKNMLDNMVATINATQVSMEERLTDHSYLYDGKTGEVRMCA